MQGKAKQGQMRLQREAKMAKKDYDNQIKKHGKIVDNFICLPDPENVYHWYFIVFGLEEPKGYKSGYYIGKITCPDSYPQQAPRIDLFTQNGRFSTFPNFSEGICLSISHHHPESWNPVWKVNQIVIGLISFWLTNESTWGDTNYDHVWPDNGLSREEQIFQYSLESADHVKNHEKYFMFKDYAEAIGIDKREVVPEWAIYQEKINEFMTEKNAAEAERQRVKKIAEEKKRLEKEKAEAEAKKNLIKDYFKLINKKGLNKYVGQSKQLRNLKKADAGKAAQCA